MIYKTILFDFDGTLTPSLELWLQAFQHGLMLAGRDVPEETIIRRFFYREYEDIASEFDLPSGQQFETHVLEGLALAFAASQLFVGVRDALDLCRQLDLKMGLVTSSPRPHVLEALDKLGLADDFNVVVTGTDIINYKPHPEPVLKALSALHAKPSETLFVGDYTADVLAGRAAGTRTALFLPRNHARFYDFAALRETHPDFVFSDYAELIDHLRAR